MSSDGLHLTKVPTAQAAMLIRKPPGEVFQAVVNPEITTRFWFTKSTGRLQPGAEVRWTWEMYDVSAPVRVTDFQEGRHLVLEMGEPAQAMTAEWRFEPRENDSTYLTVTAEARFAVDSGDTACAWAIDQMGGYTEVLAELKALLEHGIVLSLVRDHWPNGHPG